MVTVTLPLVEETKPLSSIIADIFDPQPGNSVCRHALRSLRPNRCVLTSHHIGLHYDKMYCTALQHTTLPRTAQRNATMLTMYGIAVHQTSLRCTLHYLPKLHSSAQYIALVYITLQHPALCMFYILCVLYDE